MQSTTGKKTVKQIFQTKKGFITCLKLIINELERCPTRLDNVYFANNKQASLSVFTDAFCFAHVEHNLIKLKLYNNWSAQAVNNILECAMWNSSNQSNFLTFKNWPINQRWIKICDRNNKGMYSCFYEIKIDSLVVRCREKRANCEKETEDGENYFLKLLLIDFRVYRKLFPGEFPRFFHPFKFPPCEFPPSEFPRQQSPYSLAHECVIIVLWHVTQF